MFQSFIDLIWPKRINSLTAEERSYIRETGQIPDRLISAYNSGAY